MVNIRELRELQLDALREVANMGAGHAATALSQLTGNTIQISAPRLQVAQVEEIPALIGDPEGVVAAVMMQLLGDITGRTLLVLPGESASRLAGMLLRRDAIGVDDFGELEMSAIKEAGNILVAAYVNALSDFLGVMILPSVPSLAIDQCAAVLTTAYTDFVAEHDSAFSIETEFRMDGGERVQGHFVLLPDVQSLDVILRAIRLA